jgi:serine phosphatase RsbU (regulator of sigma subunit)
VPHIGGIEIAVLYRPVSSVAGDMYQFLQPNGCGVGVLIADVTGHGVPAALIASMIKIAFQSVTEYATDPCLLLRELNRILTPELAGRLTTAGYLWVNTAARSAQYAAAGHPPLLLWRTDSSELLRIGNNGLLFGVCADCEYPALRFPLSTGDRLLMYSDGLTEPENVCGEAFGEQRLEALLKEHRKLTASALEHELLKELAQWQPRGTAQQDDITLVVLDLV